MLEWALSHLILAGSVLGILIAGAAVVHVLLYKVEVRAAIAWVGLILLVPVIGTLLYYLIGINRIRRRAVALRRETERTTWPNASGGLLPDDIARHFDGNVEAAELAHLGERVTSRALLAGNRVTPLVNGDECYPAMLEAIAGAERSVSLQTYIFDNDAVGGRFVEALAAARDRGVEVRVLVDSVGARYKRPPAARLLRERGVPVALFLPTFSTRLPSFNLRNHRKIMVVDGVVGFTGGMNLREDFLLSESPKYPGMDLHFRVEGPVVRQLQEVVAEDWEFTTGEPLWGELWFPRLAAAGESIARAVADGPDEDMDALNFVLLGAIAAARRSLRIVTPYFLPDSALVYALNTAALSGLDVDIVIPETGNLRFVTWATWGQIGQVLSHGCRVWLSPPSPFDHTKLMVVDDYWTFFGSGNWDPRSLRLNFELNVECYDRELARRATELVSSRIERARRLVQQELDERSLPLRLRDGAARLLTPYL